MRIRRMMVVLLVICVAPMQADAKPRTFKPPYLLSFSIPQCVPTEEAPFAGSDCVFKLSGDRKTGRLRVDSKFITPEDGTRPGHGFSAGLQFLFGFGFTRGGKTVPITVSLRVNSALAEISPALTAVAGASAAVGVEVRHLLCRRCTAKATLSIVTTETTTTARNKNVTLKATIKNTSGKVPAGPLFVTLYAIGVGAIGDKVQPTPTRSYNVPAVGWARGQLDVTARSFAIG